MEQKFNITMYVPLGIRHGTIQFNEEHSAIRGLLDVLGSKDTFTGTLTEDGAVEFTGTMTSLLHTFSYLAKGTIKGSQLQLTVTGDRYSFRISGEKTKVQEE